MEHNTHNLNTITLQYFLMNLPIMNEEEMDIEQRSFDEQKSTETPTKKEYLDQLQTKIVTKQMVDDNECCCICQDVLDEGQEAYVLPCNHMFHLGGDDKCNGIKRWLEKNNTCPICRELLPAEEVIEPDETNEPDEPDETNMTNYINETNETNENVETGERYERLNMFNTIMNNIRIEYLNSISQGINNSNSNLIYGTNINNEFLDEDMEEALRRSLE